MMQSFRYCICDFSVTSIQVFYLCIWVFVKGIYRIWKIASSNKKKLADYILKVHYYKILYVNTLDRNTFTPLTVAIIIAIALLPHLQLQ